MPHRKQDLCATLYEAHASHLRAYLIRKGLGRGEAEDALQEVFLRVRKRALKNPESLLGIRDTRAWLKGVARRVLADQLGCRGPTVELGACPDETAAAPDARADEEDERRLVRAAVRGLRKSLRVPLRLKWWRGWSCERIAVRLGITVPAVWGRLHKAYAELKRILKPPDRN